LRSAGGSKRNQAVVDPQPRFVIAIGEEDFVLPFAAHGGRSVRFQSPLSLIERVAWPFDRSSGIGIAGRLCTTQEPARRCGFAFGHAFDGEIADPMRAIP